MNLHAFVTELPPSPSPWTFPVRVALGLLAAWKLAEVLGWWLWPHARY